MNREPVFIDDFNSAIDLVSAVKKNESAKALLKNGVAEKSIYWIDEETEVLCKCRPDYLRKGFIVDLKTTLDARPESFSKSIYNHGYHISAAFYIDGVKAATGDECEFVIIAAESKAPFSTIVYTLNYNAIELGRQLYKEALVKVAECQKTGIWPSYGDEVLEIDLPHWGYK